MSVIEGIHADQLTGQVKADDALVAVGAGYPGLYRTRAHRIEKAAPVPGGEQAFVAPQRRTPLDNAVELIAFDSR